MERRSDRGTERQRDGGTERRSDGATEGRSDGARGPEVRQAYTSSRKAWCRSRACTPLFQPLPRLQLPPAATMVQNRLRQIYIYNIIYRPAATIVQDRLRQISQSGQTVMPPAMGHGEFPFTRQATPSPKQANHSTKTSAGHLRHTQHAWLRARKPLHLPPKIATVAF